VSAYTLLVRHLLGPAFDALRGTRTMARLSQLERLQWQSPERIREAQSQHLRRLVAGSCDRFPQYRRLLEEQGLRPEDIRGVDDLRGLPCLTRAMMQRLFESLRAEQVSDRPLRPGVTGGTTGERLSYYSSREERLTCAHARWLLSLEWTGARLGEQHLSLRQGPSRRRAGPVRLLDLLNLKLQRLDRIDTLTVVPGTLPALAGHIRRTRPHSIFAYPSTLTLLAAYLNDHAISCPDVTVVCVGGERLYERQRTLLQQVFGSEPCVRYGSNELHSVAAHCEAHGGLHIHADDFIIEVVDDEGNPLPPGKRGRILATSLHNDAMPFIRYDTGDIGALMSSACPCGRGLPMLHTLIGRTVERLRGPDGRSTDAMDLDVGRFLPHGVVQHQLVQTGIDRFDLYSIPCASPVEPSWEQAVRSLSGAIAAAVGSSPQIELHLVDDIAMSPSGKRLPFISQVCPATARTEPDRQ